jgi:glucosamine-6-phosphate deaminase
MPDRTEEQSTQMPENVTLKIVADYAEMSKAAAQIVADTINRNPKIAISVPTGGTPVGMFDQLVHMVDTGELSFCDTDIFCLDEYVGAKPSDANSLTGWLKKAFLDRIDIPADKVHMLPSTAEDLDRAAAQYEAEIEAKGGLELAVIGLGPNGHIAYNEPGSTRDSRTRVLTLTPGSIAQASGYFEGRSVRTEAMTVGVATILEARHIVLIVSGASKADMLYRTLREEPTPEVPASFLQLSENPVLVVADQAAAARLGS